jgi:hypothetical protein
MAAAIKVKARSEEIFTGGLLSKVGTIFLGDTNDGDAKGGDAKGGDAKDGDTKGGDTKRGDTKCGDPEDAGSAKLTGSGHQDTRRMPTEPRE